ncbi:MAG: tetratricopeptide repeat protein [Phycisphaerales bacterium]
MRFTRSNIFIGSLLLSVAAVLCGTTPLHAKPDIKDDGKIKITCKHANPKACREAAEAGDAEAMVRQAWRHQNGSGTKKSPMETVTWLTKAAKKDHSDAHFWLAWHLRHDVGTDPDEKAAFDHYRAAADAGNHVAQFVVGNALMNARGTDADEPLGHEYFLKSAASKYPPAMTAVGIDYEIGRGVKQDYEKARSIYTEAGQKYPEAKYNLALMLKTGRGVDPDPKGAREYLLQAAYHGFAPAQWDAAQMYLNGDGVPPDRGDAVKWLKELSKQRHRKGQILLAELDPKAYMEIAKTLNIRRGTVRNSPGSAVKLGGWITTADRNLLTLTLGKTRASQKMDVDTSSFDDPRLVKGLYMSLCGILNDESVVEALLFEVPAPMYNVNLGRVNAPNAVQVGRRNRLVVEGRIENVGKQQLTSVTIRVGINYAGSLLYIYPLPPTRTFESLKIGEKRDFSVYFDVYIPRGPGAFNTGLLTATWEEDRYTWLGSNARFTSPRGRSEGGSIFGGGGRGR